jgi:hypothetical protein
MTETTECCNEKRLKELEDWARGEREVRGAWDLFRKYGVPVVAVAVVVVFAASIPTLVRRTLESGSIKTTLDHLTQVDKESSAALTMINKAVTGPQTVTLNPGTQGTTMVPLPASMDPYLLTVQVAGPEYDYRYVFACAHWGYGSGHGGLIEKVAVLREYDEGLARKSANWGPPTFEIDPDGNLAVKNMHWPAKTIHLSYGVLLPHGPVNPNGG